MSEVERTRARQPSHVERSATTNLFYACPFTARDFDARAKRDVRVLILCVDVANARDRSTKNPPRENSFRARCGEHFFLIPVSSCEYLNQLFCGTLRSMIAQSSNIILIVQETIINIYRNISWSFSMRNYS